MPHLDIILEDDGDGCWPDIVDKWAQQMVIENDGILSPLQLAGLKGGMSSGAPSVTLRVNLPDGRVVLAQTSLALLLTAVDGLVARYGDPRFGQRRHDGDNGNGSPMMPMHF